MAHLDRQHSIRDLRDATRLRLPTPIFDYLEGGADDEVTLRRNTAAFDDVALIPQALVDVGRPDTRTRVLGCDIGFPLICAPTGASRFYHPDGEPAIARAAAAAGVCYALSTMATTSLEDVAAAAPRGPRIFQLYAFRDEGLSRELIARARAAGYDALCLTVDAAVRGKRERELRAGMGVPLRLTVTSALHILRHPAWLARQAARGPLSLANLAPYARTTDLTEQTAFIGRQLAPDVTWAHAERLLTAWNGPCAIKGVLSAEDSIRAIECGATCIIVSNHGGRQLDGAATPFEMLPAIAEAVAGRAEIILDGGIRRGGHLLKALARGATAGSIGRPHLYGLAAGGEAGVARALHLLRDEFTRAMQLCGARTVDEARTRKLKAAVQGAG